MEFIRSNFLGFLGLVISRFVFIVLEIFIGFFELVCRNIINLILLCWKSYMWVWWLLVLDEFKFLVFLLRFRYVRKLFYIF